MASPDSIVLHADQEHGGIRAVVLLALIMTFWLSLLLVRILLNSLIPEADLLGLLSCITAFPLALFSVWLIEKWLKKVWPSGRQLMLASDEIRATVPGKEERVLNCSGKSIYLGWYFHLSEFARGGHERRVPKQWLCLACQLQQADTRLVTYTFLPAKRASSLIEKEDSPYRFHRIFPAKVYDTSFRSRIGPPTRPEIPVDMLAGSDGRYWLAEKRRWSEGFELLPDDFEAFIQHLHDRCLEDEDPIR